MPYYELQHIILLCCNIMQQILRTPGGSRSDEENMAAVLAALTDMLNRGGAFAGGHQSCPGHAKGWEEIWHVQRISCSYASSLSSSRAGF